MGRKLIDISGQRFGRLIALEHPYKTKTWTCRCDCGNATNVEGSSLRSGKIRSCGCLNSEMAAARKLTHGLTGTPEYNTWFQAKRRCGDQTDKRWKDYGGRGITMCDEWICSFEAFYRDMGPRPSATHSIDRIDNDGPYAPWNCRWATDLQQRTNKRTNANIAWRGKTQAICEWARDLKLPYPVLYLRLRRRHDWTLDEIMTTPLLEGRWDARNPRR